jgi:hypothetical protein
MAFHTNDNESIITLSNYEGYLLMYVDDELTPAERGLVEAFLKFHPELEAELDMLMSTKLDPEMVQFTDKESLFAQSMAEQATDEDLLLYVDGELEGPKEKEVAKKLEKNEAYQHDYQWLLRTKSDPAEVVPYPNKEELYRRTVRRIGLPFALRIAAAVLLVASMGILYLQQHEAPAPAVASIPQKPIEQKKADEPNDATARIAAKENKEQDEQKVAIAPDTTPLIAAATPARRAKAKEAIASPKTPTSTKATKVQEDEAALAYEPAPAPRKNMGALQNVESAKKEFEPDVTYEAPQPYHTSEATAKADFAVDKEDEGRSRGNLKSLLRRATRLVERRTGINATNEDEELLIGVVALKLK